MGKDFKTMAKKFWHFIWEDDSLASWIVTAILAFILIKFLVYPGLGFLLGTSHPIVAVVSGSMEHKAVPICIEGNDRGGCIAYKEGKYGVCGFELDERGYLKLDEFYDVCGKWYSDKGITKDQFKTFSFKNGFNTGDIMILWGTDNVELGDIIVFNSNSRFDPIIHRVTKIRESDGKRIYSTKGDHNYGPSTMEQNIPEEVVIGKAVLKVPLLGYVKIWFVELVTLIGGLFR